MGKGREIGGRGWAGRGKGRGEEEEGQPAPAPPAHFWGASAAYENPKYTTVYGDTILAPN